MKPTFSGFDTFLLHTQRQGDHKHCLGEIRRIDVTCWGKPAVRPFALYMVWQVCKAVRIPVIGIGGISSTEDAIEFLIAGASAVQIGTMNFVNPKIMAQVIDGIKGYLVQNKMETVSELIGSLS